METINICTIIKQFSLMKNMNSYSVKLKHFALMLMSLSILCYESTGSNKRRFKNKLHD
jgi:hypothetical protein